MQLSVYLLIIYFSASMWENVQKYMGMNKKTEQNVGKATV